MNATSSLELSPLAAHIPAHVPRESVRDFDFYNTRDANGRELSDPYLKHRQLHDGPDVFYTPRNGGHWVVTRAQDMKDICRDAERFLSCKNMIPPSPAEGLGLVNFDGPRHTAFRNLLQPFFSARVAAQFEPQIRAIAIELINRFLHDGECEFVAQFAQKLPTKLVMKFILDLPDEDTPYLMPFVGDIAKSGQDIEAFNRAFGKIREYIAERVVPSRRANPGSDVISALIHGKAEGGRPVTEDEILSVTSVLIIGGLDTVVGALGFAAMHLARSPDVRREIVANPKLVQSATEEILRRYAISNIARVVATDLDFKGFQFKAGDMVLVPTTAAGVDEAQYEDAMSVDLRRSNSRNNLTFGQGAHYCIGNFVARAEIAVFIAEWLRLIPEFEIQPDAMLTMRTGVTNSLATLPLRWRVSQQLV